jgi:plastocyanin
MRKIGSIAVLFGFSILGACGGSGGGYNGGTPTGPANNTCPDNTFCMRASSFQPTTLTVAKGTTVSFTNSSSVEHNVVFDSPPAGLEDIGTISSGTATRSFGTAGTFAFHCTIHAGMSGSITVQ